MGPNDPFTSFRHEQHTREREAPVTVTSASGIVDRRGVIAGAFVGFVIAALILLLGLNRAALVVVLTGAGGALGWLATRGVFAEWFGASASHGTRHPRR